MTKRGTNSKESDTETHKLVSPLSPDNTKTNEEVSEPIYAVITPKSKRDPNKSTVAKVVEGE